jgi:hypothetical protein
MIPMRMKNWGNHVARGLVAGCAAVFFAFSGVPAQASIISIDGSGDTGQIIGVDQAVAISFVLTQSFTNVSISAPINSFGGSGGLWLQKNAIGPTASFADVIFAEPFDNTSVPPFATGLTLEPGLYFLIVSIDSGYATWTGSTAPVETVGAGAALGLEFYASGLAPFVPQTDFSVLFAPGALHYSVDGNAEALVPAPSAITLAGLGLLSLAGTRRRRNSIP